MKKMNYGVALFFIAVSCYVLFSARSFPGEIDKVPGPGYFPTILSVILIVLSLLLMATSGKVRSASLGIFTKKNSIVFIAGGVTLAYLALVFVFGFLIATPLYLIAIFRFFRMTSWRSVLLTACLTTAASYAVFTTVLEVQLPSGLF
jgi:putative tricarboxylic transport membrane protein